MSVFIIISNDAYLHFVCDKLIVIIEETSQKITSNNCANYFSNMEKYIGKCLDKLPIDY